MAIADDFKTIAEGLKAIEAGPQERVWGANELRRIKATDPGACVYFVLVDGQLKNVHEADAEEGWADVLMRDGKNRLIENSDGTFATERQRGFVQIVKFAAYPPLERLEHLYVWNPSTTELAADFSTAAPRYRYYPEGGDVETIGSERIIAEIVKKVETIKARNPSGYGIIITGERGPDLDGDFVGVRHGFNEGTVFECGCDMCRRPNAGYGFTIHHPKV